MTLTKQYQKQEDSIRITLNLLKSKIKGHRVDFKNNPNNWGYLANLVYIDKSLNELINFLGTTK